MEVNNTLATRSIDYKVAENTTTEITNDDIIREFTEWMSKSNFENAGQIKTMNVSTRFDDSAEIEVQGPLPSVFQITAHLLADGKISTCVDDTPMIEIITATGTFFIEHHSTQTESE